MNQDLDKYRRDYLLINDALQEVLVRESSSESEIGILHHAKVPSSPVSPVKVYHVGLAGVLGLMVSIGLVYVLSYFNIRILFPSGGVKARASGSEASPENSNAEEQK